MKRNRIFVAFLSLSTSIFIGCGGGGGSSTNSATSNNGEAENNPTATPTPSSIENSSLPDVTLKKGEYKICTKVTSFVVEPTDNPSVKFSKDVVGGDINISIASDSTGSITIKNCTIK